MAFHPFLVSTSPQRSTVIIMRRYLVVLVLAQTLRIATFLVTILPSPNYHCRPGSSEYAPPSGVVEIFFRMDALKGCGDLIFSSHTIFTTLVCLTTHKYIANRFLKAILWCLLIVLAVLVVAARKHYSADVLIGLYVTPLLWTVVDLKWPDPPLDGSRDDQELGNFTSVHNIHSESDEEVHMAALSV